MDDNLFVNNPLQIYKNNMVILLQDDMNYYYSKNR